MKVKLSKDLRPVKIGATSLTGFPLAEKDDGMDHTIYQITFEAGRKYCLVSPFGEHYSHVYYFLTGKGFLEIPENTHISIGQHAVLALSGDMDCHLSLSVRSCVIGIFTPCQNMSPKQRLTVRRLEDIIGTDRDVDWTRGRSRRYLNQSDGFNVSVHNTHAYKDFRNELEYKKQFESVIWYRGRGSYEWEQGNKSQSFDIPCDDQNLTGETVTLLLDKHDPHTAVIDQDSYAICVFSPPLVGNETHRFESDKHVSSY